MTNEEKTKEELITELELLKAEYKSLQKEKELALSNSQKQYESLFNINPIAISENDFTQVKQYFDSLREKGITNFKEYFNNHQNKRDEVFKLIQMVKLLDINEAHYKLYHVTVEEFTQALPFIFSTYGTEQIDEYINQFISLIEGKSFYVQKMPPHKTIEGKTKHVISYLQVAQGFEHDLSLVYVIYIDITDLKEAEDTLIKLNEDKDKFISILAHDLRSPFNSILGYLDLLSSNIYEYDIKTISSQLNIINNSSQRVFNLLEDVLLWAKSQSGKIPFEPEKLSFTTICNEVLLSIKPIADKKQIQIVYFEDINTVVYADQNMIKTILRNLITNAIKFSNNNSRIKIFTIFNHNKLTITVSDNGIGIDEESLLKLFEISHKHTTTGTANETGTGLGLILCKEFIELHGGEIWVESKVGKGTEFKFTLPINN